VDGTQTYLPLTPEAWAVCLAKLKNSLHPKYWLCPRPAFLSPCSPASSEPAKPPC
jgi:hypothetical protein